MFSFLMPKRYRHLNRVLINRTLLRFNYQSLQQAHPEARVAPVLKSNAYGHGLRTMAKLFDEFEAPFLAVDSLYEAYQAQKEKIKTPILVMGYTHPDNLKIKRLPFQFVVYDLETARALNHKQRRCPIHIFVDTGMHREGIPLGDLPSFLEELKKMKNLEVVGLASHLADADNPQTDAFTKHQLDQFQHAYTELKSHGFDPKWRHLAASAGAFKLNHPLLNVVRVGKACYGITPLDPADPQYGRIPLKPVLTFQSTLAQIKTIRAGESIGYGCTFTAKSKMTIGLLPAGYYDGIDRRLSNKGCVQVQGKQCPILGRVSMNMTVIDLSKTPAARVGETATIYSPDPKDDNSITKVARSINTIPYDILVRFAETLKREVIE